MDLDEVLRKRVDRRAGTEGMRGRGLPNREWANAPVPEWTGTVWRILEYFRQRQRGNAMGTVAVTHRQLASFLGIDKSNIYRGLIVLTKSGAIEQYPYPNGHGKPVFKLGRRWRVGEW